MLIRSSEKISSIDSRSTVTVAVIAFMVLIVAALLIQLWHAFATFSYRPDIQTSNASPSSNTNEYNASAITGSQLFGQFAGQLSNAQNIPTTQLQLKLRGAFTSSNPQLASAIIEGPDGQTRPYKISSKVYGEAQLKEVFGDRVVLSRNGQLETLYFPEPEISNTANSSKVNTVATNQRDFSNYDIPDDIRNLVQDNMSTQEIQQAARDLSSSAMTPEQRQALIRKRLQDLRDRARRKK